MQFCRATQPLLNLSVNSPNTQYDTAGVSELRLDVYYVRWVPLGVRRSRSRKALRGAFPPLCPPAPGAAPPAQRSRPAHLGPAPRRPRLALPGAPPEKFQRSNNFSVSSCDSEGSALNIAVIRSGDSMPPWPRSSDDSMNLVPGIWLYKFSVENTHKLTESWTASIRKLLGCSNQTLLWIAPGFLQYLFLTWKSHLQQVAKGKTSALLLSAFLC